MADQAKQLTPKQLRFVEEYLVDLNASAAALRAGYSKRTAGQMGYELLNKPEIAAAIATAQAARSARTAITADWVLERLAHEAQLTGEGASHSARVKALELLGKHQALFVDRQRLEGGVTVEVAERIVDAGERRPAPGPGGLPGQ